jgi:hypothetical protein
MTTFIRVIESEADHKGSELRKAAERWRSEGRAIEAFDVNPESFRQVPGSPFAYWVSERVRELFTQLPPFEGDGRTVKQGLATADDFRFVRTWWEVDAGSVGMKWFPFAKGGAYSPYYADVHLLVNWEAEGREIWNNLNDRGQVRSNVWMLKSTSVKYFFRPGLTWPIKNRGDFKPRPLASRSIFAHVGSCAFLSTEETLRAALGIMSARPFTELLKLMAGWNFEVGTVKQVPVPNLRDNRARKAGELAGTAWSIKLSLDTVSHVSRSFLLPGLLQADGLTLEARRSAWSARVAHTESELSRLQAEIDEIVYELYGIEGEDRRRMEEGFGSPGGAEESDVEAAGDDNDDGEAESADSVALTESLLEWTLGAAFGRFDVRLATGDRASPLDPEPFDPLPVCSPGMLQDGSGLPAREAPPDYPLELPPHGILVDDPGHPWDVVARMEAVLEQVAGDRAHAWIQEAEAILGRDLRDWLRRYAFERHLKRYSRSRRKAPAFWHLAPKSREYGIWLYSPHATRDTFYRILNDYLDPRLRVAERRLVELRQEAGDAPTGGQRRDLASQESLVDELRAFREEVARVAPLWKPHQDDGVVLNCAVLWRLFSHHRAWQSECKKKWGELAKGKYDWAGWAMHLWPDRVVRACTEDRSLAIAHGLEVALWEEDDDGTWRLHGDADGQAHSLTEQRRSPAVEAALDAFMRAD